MQRVYSEAKKFKASHGYEYCWAKSSFVYLRKGGDSCAMKIMDGNRGPSGTPKISMNLK